CAKQYSWKGPCDYW
nr:immunoglobulin heavy chain junction region [Macaca mulatta]MOV52580.1 immunoglobulin heavy chain junction region [Macaca mulatta]